MPNPIYHLDFVNGQQRTKIYDYDVNSGLVIETAAAGVATGEVIYTNDGIEFYVVGELAMTISDEGVVAIKELTYLVNPGADIPRIEFMRAVNSVPQRLAYVDSEGKLSAPSIREGDSSEAPTGLDRMELAGAVLVPNLFYAAEFGETL